MSKRKFEVGQRVWRFDLNHRVYPEGGGPTSSPIYEKHFVEYRVCGIEGRAYLIGYPDDHVARSARKVGFTKAERLYRTDAEKDANIWAREHRYWISHLVERCDVPTLKKVAELVGYKPEAS